MATIRKRLARSATLDRGPPTHDVMALDGMTIMEEIGPNMSKLPNGSLLCRNVPLARTGWMIYGPGETPIEVGEDGVAYIERRDEDLFNDITIGSLKSAAVTDEHPDDDVTTDNWAVLAKGFAVSNIRRGEGDESDVLLGDLIITDKDLIEQVLAGKRQVSLGYDADYEQIAPGVGRQTNIVCNHIALVGKGRCGPRCAIGDQDYQPNGKEADMPATTKRVKIASDSQRRVPLAAQITAARQRVLDAEAELEALEKTTDNGEMTIPGSEGGEGGDTHIHLHVDTGQSHANSPMTGDSDEEEMLEDDQKKVDDGAYTMDEQIEARFAALEAGHQQLGEQLSAIMAKLESMGGGQDDMPEELEEKIEGKTGDADAEEEEDADKTKASKTGDKAASVRGKTGDSRALETSYKAVLSQAELLVPGFRMPTFDAALSRSKTIDRMCNARRAALTACYATADGAMLIDTVTGKKDLDLTGMQCAEVATVFKAAAGAKALLNNAKSTRDSSSVPDKSGTKPAGITSISALNEANQKYWEEQAKSH